MKTLSSCQEVHPRSPHLNPCLDCVQYSQRYAYQRFGTESKSEKNGSIFMDPTGLAAAMTREVRHVGAPAKGLAIRVIMYLIWQCACSKPQSHHTHRETWHALQPRQRSSALPMSTLGATFPTTCRLLTSTHCTAEPGHRQQPHTARAPAGHGSPTET